MALTPEKKVKNQCVEILKEHEAYYFFPAANGLGRAGIPDIIVCLHGYFIAIECKAGKGKTTALQDRELQRIRNAGGVALVINENNMQDLKLYLKSLILSLMPVTLECLKVWPRNRVLRSMNDLC
jgi:Holliday junction resolvase